MSEPRVVLTTIGGDDDPAPLARDLVERRLAACVNVIPSVRSFYRWEGKIEDDREQLLLIKSTAERIDALRERLLEIHPYDVPEFVVLPVASISEAYGKWLEAAISC